MFASKFKQFKLNLQRTLFDGNHDPEIESSPSESRRSSSLTIPGANAPLSSSAGAPNSSWPKLPPKFLRLVKELISGRYVHDDPQHLENLKEILLILDTSRGFSFRHGRQQQRARASYLCLWKYMLELILRFSAGERVEVGNQEAEEEAEAHAFDEEQEKEKLELYHRIIDSLLDRPVFSLDEDLVFYMRTKTHQPHDLHDPSSSSACGDDIKSTYSEDELSIMDHPSGWIRSSLTESSPSTTPRPSQQYLDLLEYRNLLIQTLIYVMEHMHHFHDPPNHNRMKTFFPLRTNGPATSYSSQFLARVLAIGYARIATFHQALDRHCARVYADHHWTPVPKSSKSNSESSRVHKTKYWSGMTFREVLEEFQTSYVPTTAKSSSREEAHEAYTSILGWHDFHTSLDEDSGTNNNQLSLEEQTLNHDELRLFDHDLLTQCCVDMTQYGEFFILFCTEFTDHMYHQMMMLLSEPFRSSLDPQSRPWDRIPGYGLLVQISMFILQEASWRQWWDSMKEQDRVPLVQAVVDDDANVNQPFQLTYRGIKSVCEQSAQLLLNPDVFHCLLLATLETTNVCYTRSLGLTLNRLTDWLQFYEQQHGGGHLADTNARASATLALAMKSMLQSEVCEVVQKVLLFLYKCFDGFRGDLRQNILKTLVAQHFQLFLHWHEPVRQIYFHLLIYKIAPLAKRHELNSFTDDLLCHFRSSSSSSSRHHHERESLNRKNRHEPTSHHHAIHTTTRDSYEEYDDEYDEEYEEYDGGEERDSDCSRVSTLDDSDPDPPMKDMERFTLQAHWKAFDICIALICQNERQHAKASQMRHQLENEFYANRLEALGGGGGKLGHGHVHAEHSRSSLVNESRPGTNASLQIHFDHELDEGKSSPNHAPPQNHPYYLRYLPPNELEKLKHLCKLLPTTYPRAKQIYARVSLREYTDILTTRYEQEAYHQEVSGPRLDVG